MEKKSNFYREGIWKLVTYGIRENGKKGWNDVSSKDDNLFLILKNMNLMLVRGNTLVENFSFLTNEIQRIVSRGDSIAMVVKQELVKVRHVRMRFAGKLFFSAEAMCVKCVDALNHYMTTFRQSDVTDDSTEHNQNFTTSLSNYISELLNHKVKSSADYEDLHTLYPLEQIIEDCVLDVDFPTFVAEVTNILSSKLKN